METMEESTPGAAGRSEEPAPGAAVQGKEPALDQYDYDLPQQLIAQDPLPDRAGSRLLHLEKQSGSITHHSFKDLPAILQGGDVLVLNNTRVIPARLLARRQSGGFVRLLLVKAQPGQPQLWEAMVTPIKRLRPGETIAIVGPSSETDVTISSIITGADGFKRLLLDFGSAERTVALLKEAGHAPLPPYIQRDLKETGEEDRESDLERYQTVFARAPGAVAAPTAGLHFSDDLLEKLRGMGVEIHEVTLHVGPGTFKPISSSVDEHTIEPERYSISESTATAVNRARREKRRIIAVGTTSLRALESACESGELSPVESGETSLYVKPGYTFGIIDGLITNFHLSRSSLLVLVCAFAGRERIMKSYNCAVSKGYRFFSYGDAMLIV